MSAEILSVRDLRKRYGAVRANDGVALAVQAGEVHALIGENGAGKSTLINILYGIAQADSGEILWRGEAVRIKNPAHARALGIGVVFQKFSLFEPMTVLENIRLAVSLPADALRAALRRLADSYGLQVELERRVDTLSAGEKQRVEIIRCLLQEPALLVMDEPTSVLTPVEVEQLFALLRTLAADGRAVLFISHKLNEVEALCRRLTVLRGGKTVAQMDMEGVGRDDLVRLMVGDALSGNAPEKRAAEAVAGAPLLELRQLRQQDLTVALKVDSLALKRGCITGIAGIAGNGQELLLRCINGEAPSAADSVLLDGQPIGGWRVPQRVRAGILSVPTDRYHTASVGGLTLADNTLLGCMRQEEYEWRGLLRRERMQAAAQGIIADFKVAAPGAHARAGELSGGNLQKFIIGRAIGQQPRVLAVSNPTWGVDVQSALFIRRALRQMAAQGAALLVISEDLDELFEIADEIAVINGGVVHPPQAVAAALTVQGVGAQMAAG